MTRQRLDELPARLIGDKARDSDMVDCSMEEEYGIEMIAPQRSNRTDPTQDGRPFTLAVNLLLGRQYTDVMQICRAYRKEVDSELGHDREDAHTLPEKLFATKIRRASLPSVARAKAKLKLAEIPEGNQSPIPGERKFQVLREEPAYCVHFMRDFRFRRKSWCYINTSSQYT